MSFIASDGSVQESFIASGEPIAGTGAQRYRASDGSIQSAFYVEGASGGEQGPKGEQGPPGPRGEQGPQGDQGPVGLQGPEGPQGLQGPEGPEGPQGQDGRNLQIRGRLNDESELPASGNEDGDAFVVGEVSFIWYDGAWLGTGIQQGPEGPRGIQGQKGDKGDIGPTGLQGPRGLQGPNGIQGLPGVQGLQGPTGLQGQQGPAGPVAMRTSELWATPVRTLSASDNGLTILTTESITIISGIPADLGAGWWVEIDNTAGKGIVNFGGQRIYKGDIVRFWVDSTLTLRFAPIVRPSRVLLHAHTFTASNTFSNYELANAMLADFDYIEVRFNGFVPTTDSALFAQIRTAGVWQTSGYDSIALGAGEASLGTSTTSVILAPVAAGKNPSRGFFRFYKDRMPSHGTVMFPGQFRDTHSVLPNAAFDRIRVFYTGPASNNFIVAGELEFWGVR